MSVLIEGSCDTLGNTDFYYKIGPSIFCLPFLSCTTGLPGTKHRKQDPKLTDIVDPVLFPLYPQSTQHSGAKHFIEIEWDRC